MCVCVSPDEGLSSDSDDESLSSSSGGSSSSTSSSSSEDEEEEEGELQAESAGPDSLDESTMDSITEKDVDRFDKSTSPLIMTCGGRCSGECIVSNWTIICLYVLLRFLIWPILFILGKTLQLLFQRWTSKKV